MSIQPNLAFNEGVKMKKLRLELTDDYGRITSIWEVKVESSDMIGAVQELPHVYIQDVLIKNPNDEDAG